MATEKKSGSAGGSKFQPANVQRLDEASDAHSAVSPAGVVLMPRGYVLTVPEDDNMYMVKEEQLATLVSGGRSAALDWGLFALGVGLGFAPQAASSAKALWDGKALDFWNTLGLCGVVAFIVFAVVKLQQHRLVKSDTTTLAAKIQAGQKLRIG